MFICATLILSGPDTSWLNAINILLGMAAFACLVLVAAVVVVELVSQYRGRESSISRRWRSISLRQLGLGSSDARVLPDEKDLHPGRIPDSKAGTKIRAR